MACPKNKQMKTARSRQAANVTDVPLRSEPGLANAPQPGLVGRGDNDAAHMMQQERETDIKKPPNESEGTDEHMSSGEGAWGLAGTCGG